MIDHKWLSLASQMSEWPEAQGGFVVTRGGALVNAAVSFAEVRADCVDSTLYIVTTADFWNDGDLDELARIVVPRGAPPIFGIDLEGSLCSIASMIAPPLTSSALSSWSTFIPE